MINLKKLWQAIRGPEKRAKSVMLIKKDGTRTEVKHHNRMHHVRRVLLGRCTKIIGLMALMASSAGASLLRPGAPADITQIGGVYVSTNTGAIPVSVSASSPTASVTAYLPAGSSMTVSFATPQPITGAVSQVSSSIPWSMGVISTAATNSFTATGSSPSVTASLFPVKSYAIQIKGTGSAATVWDARLEGSMDNSNFTQILQHTNTTGDGVIVFSGALVAPSVYIRCRIAGLTLAPATAIVCNILGMQ